MVRELITRIGFGWATRVVAFTIFGLSILPCLFLKGRLPPRKSGPLIDYASFKDIPFILYCIACFFGFMGQYIPIFFIQSYCLEIGIDSNLAFYMTSILNAGSVLGRILPNFIADKTGPLNMLLPCTVACAILAYCWDFISVKGGVIAFSVLFGFFSGTFVSLPPACIASMTAEMNMLGTRMGMAFFLCGFGILIGSPIGGALVTRDDGAFLYAAMFCAACMTLSSVFMFMTRVALSGPKVMVKC
ncbi:Mch5p [Sugiyamaella lignohabitans]|uniref:Mch5p n=1 Tax=Sugiyamaella lignohabitans TaxID=796027 RepID=A0A167E6V0_9ASCO|nr:Mch5p [Sugiyamaella lignohabitans]ANB13716.1 Mch5p [Sugiyamaella lignohabitans]